MANISFESSKRVIAKVYRDYGITTSGWETNAIEWIAEVIDALGNYCIFEPKSKYLTVNDFRAVIPCDVYSIEAIEYNGAHLPYGLSTVPSDRSTVSVSASGEIISTSAVLFRTDVDGSLSDQSTGYFDQVRTTLNSADLHGESYTVKPGYIVPTFQSGVIKIHYLGFPTDDDGYPMVPVNIFAKEAMSWYILSRLLLSGTKHPIISFPYAQDQYQKYFLIAQNDLAMPTPDKMASIKNMWVRMIPNLSFEKQFFIDTEKGW